MKCPVCNATTHIDIDTHADGFAANLQECGDCGALWTTKANQAVVIHGGLLKVACNQ